MNLRTKIIIGTALLVLCGAATFFWKRPTETKRMTAVVPSTPAVPGPLVLQGRSYCSVTTPVVTLFAGEVAEILIGIGQVVKKDELLFKLKLSPTDSATLASRLNRRASLQTQETNIQQLTLRKAQLERNITETQQLVELGLGPRNTLADMQDQLRLLQSQLDLAERTLADTKRAMGDDLQLLSKQLGSQQYMGGRPEYIYVRAPQNGTVIALDSALHKGAIISGTLCTLGAMDPMIIRGQVHESELTRLQSAENATIALDGGKGESFGATLSRTSWAALDPGLSAPAYYIFELVVPNPEFKIKDGFKVQVTISPPKGP